MTTSAILITGATGFIGAELLRRIEPGQFTHVYGVSRRPVEELRLPGVRTPVTWVQADLPGQPIPDEVLGSVDTVVHLAATTGKAPAAVHFATNAAGTRTLAEHCVRCGVRRFLFVSSIAARFRDIRRYPYARSKQEAEAAVAAAGIPYLIVRPTLVVGREGGAWKGLARLARLPITPVFGSGKVPLQPIDVGDLAEGLLTVMNERLFDNQTLELGGRETIPIVELLQRIRKMYGRNPGRILHLPLGLLRWGLGVVEGWLGPVLPVTAGQLSSFAEDGTAQDNPFLMRLRPRLKNVEEMIERAASTGGA